MVITRMSGDDARSFNGYSVANAITVKQALAERGCACEPYCCGHINTRRTTKRALREECPNPATCWIWDYTCWATRIRARDQKIAAGSYAPAEVSS